LTEPDSTEDGLQANGTCENTELDLSGAKLGEFSVTVTATRMTP
jgi:hypothetical protein